LRGDAYLFAKGNYQSMSTLPGPPRAPRVTTRQEAILVTSDLTELAVVIVDVSESGFRIEAEETFYVGETILIGEQVSLRVPRGGDMAARILWAQGCEAGGVFLATVDLGHVDLGHVDLS
jgi:hypothetical protein